jgi:hypothetical protein
MSHPYDEHTIEIFHVDDINVVASWLLDNGIVAWCSMCEDIRQRKVGWKFEFNKKKELKAFKQAWL